MDDEVVEEITEVINEHSGEINALSGSDFQWIFWDQQVNHYDFLMNNGIFLLKVEALKLKRKTGIRWHPLFVRWCLNLPRVSPKA